MIFPARRRRASIGSCRPGFDLLEQRELLAAATLLELSTPSPTLGYGQAATIQASVRAAEPGSVVQPNGGTVTFFEGTTQLGTVPVSNGTATLTVPGLGGGSHFVQAKYSGVPGVFFSSTTDTTLKTIAGGPGVSNPALTIGAFAFSPSGELYLTDTFSNVVRRFDPATGKTTVVAGIGFSNSRDRKPLNQQRATEVSLSVGGLCIDAAGALYLTDNVRHQVLKLDLQTGLVSTIAGTGNFGTGGDGGPAINAELGQVGPITIDASGNLFVMDRQNGIIRRIDRATGIITRYAGAGGDYATSGDGGPAIDARFVSYDLAAMAMDPAGNLYLADSYARSVRRIDATTGIITRYAGGGSNASGDNVPATEAQFESYLSIAFDKLGNLFISDGVNQVIRRVDRSTGLIKTVAGTDTRGSVPVDGPLSSTKLGFVRALAFDPSGRLIIEDSYGYSLVRRIDLQEKVVKTLGGRFGRYAPGDGGLATEAQFRQGILTLAESPDGDLYVSDAWDSVVRRIDRKSGIITTVAGNGNNNRAQPGVAATATSLNGIYSMAFDGSGNLYLSELHRIVKVDRSTGILSIVAGNGDFGYSGDGGPATLAKLVSPEGLVIDSNNLLSFADDYNDVIRQVDLSTGIIRTVAGTGTWGLTDDGVPAISAKLASPTDLKLDRAGNLLFSESSTWTIRKIDRVTGILTTVAGEYYGSQDDDVLGLYAGLGQLDSFGIDSDQNLFMVVGNKIKRIDAATGLITTVAGTDLTTQRGEGTPARQTSIYPYKLLVSPSGKLIFTDGAQIRSMSLTPDIGVNLTVTPAPLVITAESKSMIAGQTVPGLTLTYAGFLPGEGPGNLSSPPRLRTTAASTSRPGTYEIIAEAASSPNYSITYVNGAMTVIAPLVNVSKVALRTIKVGKKSVQVIAVSFSDEVRGTATEFLGAFSLATIARGKRKPTAVPLAKAAYDFATRTVILTPRKSPIALTVPLTLTLSSQRVVDNTNRLIDGDLDGRAGGAYRAQLSKAGIVRLP